MTKKLQHLRRIKSGNAEKCLEKPGEEKVCQQ